jgi:hypothetical protein
MVVDMNFHLKQNLEKHKQGVQKIRHLLHSLRFVKKVNALINLQFRKQHGGAIRKYIIMKEKK